MPFPPTTFSVLTLSLASGERLPLLIERETGMPLRLALRWTVRSRRYRVQASTLEGDLRVLSRLYAWAMQQSLDLDAFLLAGQLLTARQIEAFALYLRQAETTTFDHHLHIARDFLQWAIDCAAPHGYLSHESAAAAHIRLSQLFRSLHTGSRPSEQRLPLSQEHITTIRTRIGPTPSASGAWRFPPDGFPPATCLRNWLMFEMALGLGLRRGELLKLRLDGMPRGADDGIKVVRLPDDPHDARRHEPAVKTAERVIPAPRSLLYALRAYLTLPAPFGRVAGKSPYLFVTRSGSPVSIATANDIMTGISQRSGIHLSWHQLRHNWAERMARVFLDEPNGIDRLLYLGGWTHPLSIRRYVKQTIAESAAEQLRRYHQRQEDNGAPLV